jgi:ABC-type polysaccharide/polyol phosphate export permease
MMISPIWMTQVRELTLANLKVRYRKTWIGFLWVILNPLILLAIQGFVFSEIFHIQIEKYIFYLVAGLLPWIFISQTLEMGTSLLKSQSLTIKAFSIKPFQIIAALTLENIINLGAASLLVLVPLLSSTDKPSWILLLWIANAIPLVLAVISLTFLAATINVLFKDLRFVISFVLNIFYFITPIFYSADYVPERWQSFLKFNLFYILINPFQQLTFDFSLSHWGFALIKSTALSGALAWMTFLHWRRIKNSFYLHL